ncbi:MAG: rubredoxin [Candidatus Eisenbacteria bacterium]
MARYRCDVCKVYEYDPERGDSVTGMKPGTGLKEFPDGWACPICLSDRTHLHLIPEEEKETRMADIHRMSASGESIVEPMRTLVYSVTPRAPRGWSERLPQNDASEVGSAT